jgi:peptidoglycan hydrolase-like protein with peptidoglycan-binding domain
MFDLKGLLLFEQQQSYIDFVKEAQRKLISLGYDLGPRKDDGVIGRLTRKALSDFQLKNGGNGKGNLGPFTAKKLGIQYVSPDSSSVKGSDGKTKTDSTGKVIQGSDGKTKTDSTGKVIQGSDGKTDKSSQSCSKFEMFPTVIETLTKVCAGQTTGVAKGPDGCSEYVRQKTGKWQGNAWHAYKTKGYPSLSGFKSLFSNKSNLDTMANVFQKINSQSSGISASGIKSSGTHDNIRSLMGSAIPSQSSFKGLNTGDVVGIYYPSSQHHGEAFFQAATGMSSDGTKVTAGPYFVVDENGKTRPWQISDIGKNVKIKPGKSLQQGEHFGFNTHLGFVGAKKPNGEPIIYHNVSGNILATPLSDMGGKFSLVWARPA